MNDENLYKARPYQLKLLEKCMRKNSIVFLQTGSGKTYIAVMLIKNLSNSIREGGKRTIFLANTVPLIQQQADVMRRFIDVEIEYYYGERVLNNKQIDSWNKEMWLSEFEKKQILVMSPQILVTLIAHSFISFERINLIVFDECHHSQNNHPYAQIMNLFKDYNSNNLNANLPRICGLTATIVNKKCKKDEFYKKMKQLETKMESKVITASVIDDTDDGTKFVFKPKIEIIKFNPQESINNDIFTCIGKYISKLQELSVYFKQNDIEEKCYIADITRYFRDLSETINEIGFYGFYLKHESSKEYLNGLVTSLMQNNDQVNRQFGQILFHILQDFNELYSAYELEDLFQDDSYKILYLSSKIKELLNILKEQYVVNTKFSAIIFVYKRNTAGIIDLVLKAISEIDEFRFIKSNYIVGHNVSGSKSRQISMEANEQQEVLKKFRNHEINVLIGTNVVEEGVDVPVCNIVIRFDMPQTLGSFVQSKGRARAKNSIYYLFAEEDNDIEDIKTYRSIELDFENEMKTKNLNDSSDDENDEFFEDSDCIGLEPYKKGNAQITALSSINLITRYSQMLTNDGIILYPKWKIYEYQFENRLLFKAELTLPPNSIMNESIESQLLTRKKTAKMSAALKMCAKLDELGELDENLIPITRESWTKSHLDYDLDNEDEEHKRQGFKTKIGSTKTKRVYTKKIASSLKDNNPNANDKKCYLFHFEFKNDNGQICNTDFNLGFITTKKMDIFPSFRSPSLNQDYFLSVKQGNLNGEFEFIIQKDKYCEIVEFNQLLFGKILNFKLDFDFKTSLCGGLVVPLNARSHQSFMIDFKLMKSIENLTLNDYAVKFPNHHSCDERFLAVFNGSLLEFVKIHNDKRPTDRFPNDHSKDFIQHFKEKYNLDTTNSNQPMVQLEYFDKSIDLFHNSSVKVKKPNKYDMLFIAEHVKIITLNVDLYKKLRIIPSIFYRMNSILRTNELLCLIHNDLANYIDVNCYSFEDGSWFDSIKFNRVKEINQNDCKSEDIDEIMNLEELKTQVPLKPEFLIQEKYLKNGKIPLPNVYELLQVLTLKNANDLFDLERYEILGDCFLKLTVSQYLYLKFPNTNEGNLTGLKSERVSNRYLFKLAKHRDLPGYLMSENFEAKKIWFPPNTIINENHIQSSVGDKSVADCFEALLGLYLIKCGSFTARQLLTWFKFIITRKDGIVDFTNFNLELSSHINETFMLPPSGKFEKLEERLGYRFKNETYLQQAFTHPSFMHNKCNGSYQRLEFIGDAVLDIIVTQYLFNDKKEHSPGELTDLRQALVNNKFFAHLALDLGFEKYLEYDNQQIFFELNEFIKANEKYTPQNAYFSTQNDDNNDENGLTMDDYDCPKFLADAFEAVAGAIFIDSGFDLNIVWDVYYKILAPYFLLFKQKTPRSPIKHLLDLKPQAKFTVQQLHDDFNRIYYEAKVTYDDDNKECIATASNKTKAKLKVCKQAIKKIDPNNIYYYF